MSEQKEYIVRVQSNRAWTFGLGEVVVPGVAYFSNGNYNLTMEQTKQETQGTGQGDPWQLIR